MTVVIERRADGEWIALRADRLPSTVWGSNLRAFLPRAGWQSLSRQTTERAGRKCEVCGMQAPAARTLDCNELWSFDAETSTQSLLGVIALCEWCHLTQHSGRAANLGRAEHVIDVLAHINRWSRQRAWRDFDESAERFRSMSRIEWDLDVSLLAGWISLAEFSGFPHSNQGETPPGQLLQQTAPFDARRDRGRSARRDLGLGLSRRGDRRLLTRRDLTAIGQRAVAQLAGCQCLAF